MHVTIALPWWWHTIQDGNDQLTKSMAQRFKQTLLLKFHYPFQIELDDTPRTNDLLCDSLILR